MGQNGARIRDLSSQQSSVRRRRPSDGAVLSFGQQSLWFIEELMPGTATYNVPSAMRLAGCLDADAFGQALEEIVRRHEVLRTTICLVDSEPMQFVSSSWPRVLTRVDLTSVPESRRGEELDRVVAREASRPFDLSRDLMLRAFLIRLAPEEHVVLFVTHHVAWDEGSQAILHEELQQLYAERIGGERARLRDLPIQYADFAVWQRSALSGTALERLVEYWGRQLRGAPPYLDLPTDKPRRRIGSFAGRKHRFVLPPSLTEGAARFCVRSKATVFMTLLSAFAAFIAGLSGRQDVIVGSPMPGRVTSDLEKLIGFFINTVPLRIHVDAERTFAELLVQVRDVALDAYAHQQLPFEKLVEVVRPPRDLNRNPIVQINFRVSQAPPRKLALPRVAVTPLELVDTGTSKFDLALEIAAAPGGVSYFEYNTDLFDERTIVRMQGEFERLLHELMTTEVPIGTLSAFREAQPS